MSHNRIHEELAKKAAEDAQKRVDVFDKIPPQNRERYLNNLSGKELEQLVSDIKTLMGIAVLTDEKSLDGKPKYQALQELHDPVEKKIQVFTESLQASKAATDQMQKEMEEKRAAVMAMSPAEKQTKNDYAAYMILFRDAERAPADKKNETINKRDDFITKLSDERHNALATEITRRNPNDHLKYTAVLEEAQNIKLREDSTNISRKRRLPS